MREVFALYALIFSYSNRIGAPQPIRKILNYVPLPLLYRIAGVNLERRIFTDFYPMATIIQ